MSDHHLHLHAHNEPGTVHPPAQYRVGLIDEYVESAAVAGVTELGFTEHLYRCVEAEDALGRFWDVPGHPELSAHSEAFVSSDRTLSLEAYVQVVLEAKHRGLPVQLGLEIDFFPESIDAVLELIEPYPWDFLIGSVHWIGPWAIDSSEVAWEFDRRGVDQAWYDYFQLVEALAASGTVSLELAAQATPMVIAYKLSWLTQKLAERMVNLDTVTLVNLVSESRTVPECLGPACQPSEIADQLRQVHSNPRSQADAMRVTMERLGRGGEAPGLRAARAVLERMKR